MLAEGETAEAMELDRHTSISQIAGSAPEGCKYPVTYLYVLARNAESTQLFTVLNTMY
jgi:hypothetical protein